MHDDSCEICGVERQREVFVSVGTESINVMFDDVRNYGYHKIGVFSETGEDPEFAYTIGLSHVYIGQPEIVIFGLNTDIAFEIIDGVVDLISQGERFDIDVQSDDILEEITVRFVDFKRVWYPDFIQQAKNFYGGDQFEVVMLVWPDSSGQFPWSENSPRWLRERQPAYWMSY